MKDLTSWSFFVFTIATLLFTQSCNDPTTFGADLLEEDQTELQYFDTISMQAATVAGEPITINSTLTSYPAYLCGKMKDPIFGTTTAEIFMQLQPRENTIPFLEDGYIIDSVVLGLPYETNYFYGRISDFYDVEIRRLTEVVSSDANYTSDTTFASSDSSLLGSISYVPRYDSVTYINYYGGTVGDTVSTGMLRIPLDKRFGGSILGLDSATLVSETSFLEAFPGLHIKPTSTNAGMPAFDIDNSLTGIYIYYHIGDNFYQYQLRINTGVLRYVSLDIDDTNSVVGNVLAGNAPPEAENLLFTQGMIGPTFRIDFPHLDQLRGRNLVINKAELEMRVGSLTGDSSDVFLPTDQLILVYLNEDGERVLLDDVYFASNNLEDVFGGVLTDAPGEEPDIYTMNIGTYFQKAIDGEVDNSIYVIVLNKAYTPSRCIIYGPDHPEYPMKLKVSGTIVGN